MKKPNIEKLSRKAAEAIIVELAAELPVAKLSLAELANVLGAIQLGYARGYLAATTAAGDSLRHLVPGLAPGGRRLSLVKPVRK